MSVVQREWTGKNPRATFKDPITVNDVLNSRTIAHPFRQLPCCLVTDGGGALIPGGGRASRTTSSYRRRPISMAEMGPGLRREDKQAR